MPRRQVILFIALVIAIAAGVGVPWWRAFHSERKLSNASPYASMTIPELQQVLAKDSTTWKAQRILVRRLHDAKRYPEVVEVGRAYSRAKPEDIDAYYYLGNALIEVGKPADAIATLRASLSISDQHSFIQYDLGRAFLALGEFDSAAVHVRHAAFINPSNPQVMVAMGNILLAMGLPDSARTYFRGALFYKDTLDPEVYRGLGTVMLHRGYPDSALVALRLSEKLDSLAPRTDLMMGTAYRLLGQPDSAAHWYARSLAREPHDVDALIGYSWAQMAQGHLVEAKAGADSAVVQAEKLVAEPLWTKRAQAYYHRATLREKLHDRAGAVEDYRRASQFGKSSDAGKAARDALQRLKA